MKLDTLFASERAVEVIVHLTSGEALHWPISDNEGIKFEVPIGVFKVITAEVPVEIEDDPRQAGPFIPGDAKRKKPKKKVEMQTRVVRTLEWIPWAHVKRLQYIFGVVADEETKEREQMLQ